VCVTTDEKVIISIRYVMVFNGVLRGLGTHTLYMSSSSISVGMTTYSRHENLPIAKTG
jgi:hypothetical protein